MAIKLTNKQSKLDPRQKSEQDCRQRLFSATPFILLNIISTSLLVFLLIVYRTGWGQSHLNTLYLFGLAGLSLASTLVLWRLLASLIQNKLLIRNIRANLEPLAQCDPTDDPKSQLQKLGPLPTKTRPDPIVKSWNHLLTVIDQVCTGENSTQGGHGLDQVFGSYESQRLSKLFDALGDGVLLADTTGSVVLVNRACEGMLSRSLSQIIGHSVLTLFNEAEATSVLQKLLDKETSGNTQTFEITREGPSVNRKDKSSTSTLLEQEKSIFRINCQRIDSSDASSDILILIRDISQQKISESSQNDFVAHVSHELRSPLANIRAYSETLLSDMELDAKTQKEAFNVINDETVRLSRMINDVLDLSQMEAGAMRLDKSEVITDRLIRQCINDLKAMAASKNITLQTNFHPKIPNLYADRDKLAIVLNNLLSNAIKYTPDGGTVFFETNVDEEFVYVKITDTGYGIGPADIDKVFEKFYRVDREETAHISGTGLGLSTSREIVTQHGGAIDVTSKLDKGTEMLIKLPLSSVGPAIGPAIK